MLSHMHTCMLPHKHRSLHANTHTYMSVGAQLRCDFNFDFDFDFSEHEALISQRCGARVLGHSRCRISRQITSNQITRISNKRVLGHSRCRISRQITRISNLWAVKLLEFVIYGPCQNVH